MSLREIIHLKLAGTFTISVTANPGVNFTEVDKVYLKALTNLKGWFSAEASKGLKQVMRQRFYSRFASDQGKAFTLAEYAMFTGDPGFYKKDFEEQSVCYDG